jgi:UDPglucose 6-dehydrogenase
MNVCVVGYGHFASILAVCLAKARHLVAQADEEPHLLRENQRTPDSEPGYTNLAETMRARGRLVPELGEKSSSHPVDVYWVAYDVPLDPRGAPDIAEVVRRILVLDRRVLKSIPFLVSCQWPVGTLAQIEAECPDRIFVYVLENVRAGKALSDFQHQTDLIVGIRQPLTHALDDLLHSVCENLLTMSPESAELSKHALNAFIALQIAFINEIAEIAETVNASHVDVTKALLSDPRVSPLAPLHAGAPFGGGSLQRDLLVLESLSEAPIIHAIRASNDSRLTEAHA